MRPGREGVGRGQWGWISDRRRGKACCQGVAQARRPFVHLQRSSNAAVAALIEARIGALADM